MPIVGRKPDYCFAEFRDHVAELLAATISDTHVFNYEGRGTFRLLTFLHGDATTVPLTTKFGTLHFYLGQLLEAVKEGRQYRLRTHEYEYRIQQSPGLDQQALLRWEYKSSWTPNLSKPCRHHVQAGATAQIDGQSLDLNHAHIPTGWVTIEEIIRFLITELGFKPPCADDWPPKLAESERAFFEQFTSKRYKA